MTQTTAQCWIDHHLNAASAAAEESGDKEAQAVIDRAMAELVRLRSSPGEDKVRGALSN